MAYAFRARPQLPVLLPAFARAVRFAVRCEFVPSDGSAGHSDEELQSYAEAARESLAEHECWARGGSGRLTVEVKLPAEDEDVARHVGRDLIFAAILRSGPRTYRLESTNVSRG